jgi:tRNA (guanine-N(7)-)-methyltransferase subunit TRM82
MAFPYQRIEACNRSNGNHQEWVFIGASGSDLVVQSSTGASSVWPAADNIEVRVGLKFTLHLTLVSIRVM